MESEPRDVERALLIWSRVVIDSLRGEDRTEDVRWLERYLSDADEKMWRESVVEVRFWVAFGAGRISDAYDAAMEHGRVHPDEASHSYAYAAICGLWERDRERAAAALAALDATEAHGRVVNMNRRTIQAGLAALDGRTGEAQSAFREALAGWRDLGSPWRVALTAITMATLLGPANPEVRAAAEAAREVLTRLGAQPFLQRLDAGMQQAAPGQQPVPAATGQGAGTKG
jgi:hypothetical protein